jgi:chaperonin cofactor prefoldin
MIKFSHAELDRRVVVLEAGHRTLEDKVEKLEERIDRLESSTH